MQRFTERHRMLRIGRYSVLGIRRKMWRRGPGAVLLRGVDISAKSPGNNAIPDAGVAESGALA